MTAPATAGSTALAAATMTPTVALVGAPNVGKSTLFNALTGARQRTGNWPGTTVEVTSGSWRTPTGQLDLVDLPGTTGLAGDRSTGEQTVADVLTADDPATRPSVLVVVMDAANLARGLYLWTQLAELGTPAVVALGMGDIAAARGLEVDSAALAGRLGAPVIPVSGRRRQGLAELAAAVAARSADPRPVTCGWTGTGPAEPDLADPDLADPDLAEPELADPELADAERRYGWVRTTVAATVRRPHGPRPTVSDRLDRILTSRWFGAPIFLLVMWAVFVIMAAVAAPVQDLLGEFIQGPVTGAAARLLATIGIGDTWFAGLLLSGLFAGVGELLTFVPLMIVMFALLTLLEDSGYLTRAAVVADRLLRPLGLPGQAFLPLVIGFGCNVPAVTGARLLTHRRHRLVTVLLAPYVTCTARLPVYVLLAGAFFDRGSGTVVFAMYLLSIALVVLVGLLLRCTLLRGQPRPALVLELPPYRLPVARAVAAQTGRQLAGFLRTVGGIVVLTVAAVWLATAIPVGGGQFDAVAPEESLYGAVSRTVAPIFAPAGFDDWQISGALVTGLVAKEAVVATLAQTHRVDEADTAGLGERLQASLAESSGGHPIPAVLAVLVFVLAYTPCVATLGAQRAQVGLRWTAVGVGLQLATALLLATAVFQLGRLIL